MLSAIKPVRLQRGLKPLVFESAFHGRRRPLLALLTLQAIAIAINLEHVFQVRFPRAAAKRLPTRAAPLLPKTIARRLRSLASDRPLAAAPLELLVRRLGVPTASMESAATLLDRVQRAAEVWQIQAEAFRGKHAAARTRIFGRRRRPAADVVARSELRLADGCGLTVSTSGCPLHGGRGLGAISRELIHVSTRFSKTSGAAEMSTPHDSSRRRRPGEGAGSGATLRHPSFRMLRTLDAGLEADYLWSKALVARAFALAIRRSRPALPQTAYEVSKVAHSTSVANAMLEAYARALATHSETAVRFYRSVADAGRTPGAAQATTADSTTAVAATAASPASEPLSPHSLFTLTPGSEAPVANRERNVSSVATPTGSSRAAARPCGALAAQAKYNWQVHMCEVEMQSRLGAGAYGEVFAGRWRRNAVAVKVMSHCQLHDDEGEGFFAEMQLLSELRHPNIVQFLGASLVPASMAILFELCPGSLFDLLHKSEEPSTSTTHMLNMIGEVALGMHYLHTAWETPILHLDLKSANGPYMSLGAFVRRACY